MVAKRHDPMTVEDFLALDRENLEQKYAFINGEMVAMAGGTLNHGTLLSNTHGFIQAHLRKSPCRVLSESTLKIEDDCHLPDIMVTCNEQDINENKTYIEHPKLVVEVLSPTTEKYDRMDKLWIYTQCPSIQEYILVNWDIMIIQKMTRKGTEGLDSFRWIDSFHHQGESIELETIGLSILVDDIYEKVVLPPLDALRGFRKRGRKKNNS
ncbi:MAG TPA: Uma2 family endonuclease [Ktedonobacteraceae bacterium]|nr:Uma2 family endonuclease [Ktedonobacteraceae bacterium]